ncbi:MAG TPA: hypothetical protein VMF90_17315 [Rhizobiaceae bacterium]|nr:hypothetical protein [Rhizobiaceae bacterium]
MTSTDNSGSTAGLALLPPLWLVVVMAMSAWGLWSVLMFGGFDLPASIAYFIYASMIVSAITLLWGLWMLVLAASRAPGFAKHFIAWQTALIVYIVAEQVYVLLVPDFVFSLRSVVTAAAEIAIGVFCIAILRRKPAEGEALPLQASTGAVQSSALGTFIFAVLGLIVGGALGFGVGLGAGILIVEVTDMSCFEGACGFFAFFLGLGGVLVGAVAGLIFALRRARRGGRSATAA